MMAAGLNPMLAYHQGGASSPSGGQGSTGAQQGAQTRHSDFKMLEGLSTAAQIANIKADTLQKEAGTEEIKARTPTHGASIEVMKQRVTESIANVQKILQETKTSASSAAQKDQQVVNMKEAIPQIRATIDLLKAQVKQTGTMTGKTEEETREIRQRIHQNLPALENALKHLELRIGSAKLPKAEQDASFHGEPALGTFSALLRNLLPLNEILGR